MRIKPSNLAPCTAPACASGFSSSRRTAKMPRTSTAPMQGKTRMTMAVRCASSTASASSPAAQLTWNDFLALRRTRRKISVVSSGVTSIATLYAGLRVFVENGYDSSLSAMLGLDPLVVTGMSAVGMMAAGWLIGPIFGGAVFNLRYRASRGEILSKEREFYSRIKNHRVDPTSSSMANPVPDYYGEKIGSVADYRRWLKDQRAFNLKRGAYMGSK
ncbi:Pam17-domain-containing protein [Massarina eburnea CBS 473.64]|uniref:Presequence translocated-associated motor subunit PAM17 n=1 Tax=Massarina eburnea CBS 473.64 TaxID=1395130 RepID=A0A6A6SC03_9PLEO|nr:Pam17-domain-containing protein [Massarina eburnea CBS 473.64]